MAHIKTSIVIRRPQDETFAYLTDPRNAKDWSSEAGRRDLQRRPDGGHFGSRHPQAGP